MMTKARWAPHRHLTVALVSGLFLGSPLLEGCAINPATGLPIATVVSTETEKTLGKEAAEQVAQAMGLTDDPKLTAYVQAIGQRLAEQSPRKDVPYEFHVVEMQEPNAFALPGGYIYVSRGILPILNSEAELAGVIGHEIGHVAARHSVRRISPAAPFAIVGGIVGGVTSIVSPRLGQALGAIPMLAGGLIIQPYSRDQERDADKIGVKLAADSGYDPAGLSKALHQLEREEELLFGGPRKASFFDSHPKTLERVEKTTALAKEQHGTPHPPIAATPADFLAKLDGLIVGPNPAEGVFVDDLFVQPDLGFQLQFPRGWEGTNSRQAVSASEQDGAGVVLVTIVREGDDPMEAVRDLEKKSETKLADKVESFKVGDLPAARLLMDVDTKQGRGTMEMTWIGFQHQIYLVAGLCPVREYKRYEPTFASVVKSFAPLRASERDKIQIARLRVVTAREGESLDDLVTRTGSAWKAKHVAVANAVDSSAALKAGQLLKIVIKEPYAGSAKP